LKQIREFKDERLKGYCVYCEQGVSDPSNDHVPSKSLLKKPFPPDIPTIKACRGCNERFALDEEYFAAFLSAVLSGSTEPDDQVLPSAANSFRENNGLRERIDHSRSMQTQLVLGTDERITWFPEYDRIRRVIVKNAQGHIYFELGDPSAASGCPTSAWATTIENLNSSQRDRFFEMEPRLVGWPEVGSRAMIRAIEGQDMDGGWVVVQDGVYRYSVEQGTRVRSVLFERVVTEVLWDNVWGI